MIPEVTAEEIDAGRVAWPHLTDEQLPDHIRRTKAHAHVREASRAHMETVRRSSRRERIANNVQDPGDLESQPEIVCPHCGHWMPGEVLPVKQMTGTHLTQRHFEVECAHCREHIGCRAEVKYTFTTFELDS